MCSLYICPPLSALQQFLTPKRTLKVRTLKERLKEANIIVSWKEHWLSSDLNIDWRNVFVSFERSWKEIIESMEKLSWKIHVWFSQAYWRFYGFSRVAISKWSMRLAWSYARLAVCSLQILRTAQTSLLKAISHCLMAYCLWYPLFSILTPMAESLITRSVNSHWIQNWSRTRSDSSTFGSARWS